MTGANLAVSEQDLKFAEQTAQIFGEKLANTAGFQVLATNISELNSSLKTGISMVLDTTKVVVEFTGKDLLQNLPKEVEANLLNKVGLMINQKINDLKNGK